MMPVFRLCDYYVRQWAALDPVTADLEGLHEPFVAYADYGPEGYQARADLIASTLAGLEPAASHLSSEDRLAAGYLRERLTAERDWLESGEHLRLVRAFYGLGWCIPRSVEVLARDSDDAWRNVVARLTAVPRMLASWRAGLDAGLARGLPAPRRQVLEEAAQAAGYGGAAPGASGRHAPLIAEYIADYGDGPLASELAAAVAGAHEGYLEMARYLREDYAARACEADSAGPERYAVEARLHMGADLDFREVYEWGWTELRRVQEELAAEVARIGGASVAEAIAILDESEVVTGAEAYRDWLDERHQWAIGELDGAHFDIPAPLRTLEVVLAPGASVPYYTGPSEDLSRPGRTWWPAGEGQERFPVWRAMSVICHEGVPGHHLQIGVVKLAGDRLSRFARSFAVAAHTEGWAMYAELLAGELGWYTRRGERFGMLALSALRAARLVSDLGLHLGLHLGLASPDGSRWTFEKACEVISTLGHAEPQHVYSEVSRSCAWPSRLSSSLLGRRAWLEAREEASSAAGFDLKRWHTAALDLGPVGLAALPAALRRR